MDRRCVAVCTTVILSLLALADSSAARTSRKSTLQKRAPAATSKGAKSRDSKTAADRSAPGCAPCAAKLTKNKRGRSLKGANSAKNPPCHPKDYVDPKIAANYKTALRDMKRAGIKPQITSAWRSSEHQEQLHECSLSARCRRANPGLYHALPAGKSLHEAGFAIDIAGVAAGRRGEKRLTPRGNRIVSIMRSHGFNWRYRLADPAHFEADPRRHGYRNAQQAIVRTQTACQVRLAKDKAHRKTVTRTAANRGHVPSKGQLSARSSSTGARRRVQKIRA
jgi:LAS superfamily LD-carboxypeptidase LdcB